MRGIAISLALSYAAFGQTATMAPIATPVPQATPGGSATASSIVFGIGGGYNHYSTPASYETMVNVAVQIGSSAFWSISTVSLQPKVASVRSGFGYAIKKSGPVTMILLADAGAVVSSVTTANVAVSATAPATGAFALGNVGGGILMRYDLGDVLPSLKNIGIGAGFRMAAITSQSVQPEVLVSISYVLK
jgi:hypothetical protein